MGFGTMRCGAPTVEDQTKPDQTKDRLRELCQKASNEMDSAKLLQLIKEINLLLDDRKPLRAAEPSD
jgi:hypothetical protein